MKIEILALVLCPAAIFSVSAPQSQAAPNEKALQRKESTQQVQPAATASKLAPSKPRSLVELRTELQPLYGWIVELSAKAPITEPATLYSMARVHIVMGRADEAEKTIARLQNIKTEQYAVLNNEELYLGGLADIGAVAWQIGAKDDATRLMDKAVEAASQMAGAAKRRNMLLRIARPMVKSGATETAQKTLRLSGQSAAVFAAEIEKQEADPTTYQNESELERRLRLSSPRSESSTSFSMKIVELQLKIGDVSGARTTLEGLTPPKEPNAETKSYKISDYMRYWMQQGACGDKTGEKQALAQTLKAVRANRDETERADALRYVAQVVIEAGALDESKAVLAEFYQAINEMGAGEDSLNRLVSIAELYDKAGDKANARKALADASRMAPSMGIVGQIRMSAIAQTYAEIGEAATAKAMSDSISNDLRIGVLAEVARVYFRNGKTQPARLALAEVVRSTTKMEHLPTRARNLASIAEVQSEFGEDDAATTTLNAAEAAARANKDSDSDSLYSRIAEVRALTGNWAQMNTALQAISSPELRLRTMNIGLLRVTGFGD